MECSETSIVSPCLVATKSIGGRVLNPFACPEEGKGFMGGDDYALTALHASLYHRIAIRFLHLTFSLLALSSLLTYQQQLSAGTRSVEKTMIAQQASNRWIIMVDKHSI